MKNQATGTVLPLILGSMAAILILLWHIPPAPVPKADILIISPHPDDSVLCCGGLIQQSLRQGKSVLVVNLTNGDDFASAAAILFHKRPSRVTTQDMANFSRIRQIEDAHALRDLGLSPRNTFYLGYPDGALDELYRADDVPFLHMRTLKSATYGLRFADYHSTYHHAPALYMKQSAVGDLAEIITRARPDTVYVTSAHDIAPDHNATYWLTKDAIALSGYAGRLYTYVIHAPGWPRPNEATPLHDFDMPDTQNGEWQDIHLPWPPPIKVTVPAHDAYIKYQALSRYHSQLLPHDFPLFGFVKNEEVWWIGQ